MAIAHRIGDDATVVRVSNLVVGIEPERFDETDALTGEALVRHGPPATPSCCSGPMPGGAGGR